MRMLSAYRNSCREGHLWKITYRVCWLCNINIFINSQTRKSVVDLSKWSELLVWRFADVGKRGQRAAGKQKKSVIKIDYFWLGICYMGILMLFHSFCIACILCCLNFAFILYYILKINDIVMVSQSSWLTCLSFSHSCLSLSLPVCVSYKHTPCFRGRSSSSSQLPKPVRLGWEQYLTCVWFSDQLSPTLAGGRCPFNTELLDKTC